MEMQDNIESEKNIKTVTVVIKFVISGGCYFKTRFFIGLTHHVSV